MTMDTNFTFQLPLFPFLLRKGVECQWVNKLVKRCINLFHSKWEIDEVISIYWYNGGKREEIKLEKRKEIRREDIKRRHIYLYDRS